MRRTRRWRVRGRKSRRARVSRRKRTRRRRARRGRAKRRRAGVRRRKRARRRARKTRIGRMRMRVQTYTVWWSRTCSDWRAQTYTIKTPTLVAGTISRPDALLVPYHVRS